MTNPHVIKYGTQLDFDCQDEPPKVYIATQGGQGTCIIEVLEEPEPLTEKWSWEEDDWQAGSMAQLVVEFLNFLDKAWNEGYSKTQVAILFENTLAQYQSVVQWLNDG